MTFLFWSLAALIAALGLAAISVVWLIANAVRFDGPPNVIIATIFSLVFVAAVVAGESALFTFWPAH